MKHEREGISCEDVTKFLGDYLDCNLEWDIATLFECHVGKCRNCVIYLENYRSLIRINRETLKDRCAEVQRQLIEAVIASLK